jgi:hypothetical protein
MTHACGEEKTLDSASEWAATRRFIQRKDWLLYELNKVETQ